MRVKMIRGQRLGEIREVTPEDARELVGAGWAAYVDNLPGGHLPPGFETKEGRKADDTV